MKLSLGHTFDPSRIKTGDDVYFECKVLDGSDNKRKQRNSIEWYHNVSTYKVNDFKIYFNYFYFLY